MEANMMVAMLVYSCYCVLAVRTCHGYPKQRIFTLTQILPVYVQCFGTKRRNHPMDEVSIKDIPILAEDDPFFAGEGADAARIMPFPALR